MNNKHPLAKPVVRLSKKNIDFEFFDKLWGGALAPPLLRYYEVVNLSPI